MCKKIFIFVFSFLKVVKKSCFIIIIMINCTASLFAQEAKGGVKKNTITIENKTLTLEEIIDRVLQENLTLQAAKFDIVMTNSESMKFDGKYGTTANLEGVYSRSKIPDKAVNPFTGQKSYSYSATASLSKMFSTATTAAAGVSELFYDSNDQSVPGLMGSYAGLPQAIVFCKRTSGAFEKCVRNERQNRARYTEKNRTDTEGGDL